jgi:hypothetical protein
MDVVQAQRGDPLEAGTSTWTASTWTEGGAAGEVDSGAARGGAVGVRRPGGRGVSGGTPDAAWSEVEGRWA